MIRSTQREGLKHLARCIIGAWCLSLGSTAAAAENDPSTVQSTTALVQAAIAKEHGEGVQRDLSEAAALYCDAARMQHPEALYRLAWMYLNGRGVERDDATAVSLLRLSAQRGDQYAARLLPLLGDYEVKLPECLTARGVAEGEAGPDPFADLPAEKLKYAELVRQLAEQYEIDSRLALAVAQAESNFNPKARSPKNAWGLMQLIPETAERFNVKDRTDPADNVRGGLAYLRWLLSYYRGRVAFAIAAYNAGERVVDRYGGIPPYPETRSYVEKIRGIFRNPEHPFHPGVAPASPVVTAAMD